MDEVLKIGGGQPKSIDLIRISQGCYVLSRVALNSKYAMFNFFPPAFMLMHHSLELAIKALLLQREISYQKGKKGHQLIYLLQHGAKDPKLAFLESDVLDRADFLEIIGPLQESYEGNKYAFPGYNIKSISLRDRYDELMFLLSESFWNLLQNYQEVPERFRVLEVPETLLPLFEEDLKQPFIIMEVPNEL